MDVEISAGEVTDAEIVVSPLVGEGILDVAVNWPSGVIETPVVQGWITPAGDLSATADFVYGADGLSAKHTQTLATGYYMISIQLYDSDVLLWGAIEAVRIISGELSKKTFTLVKDVNRGGLDLEIITKMDNPIEVTFNGALEFLSSGTNMTVFASTSEPVDSFQWYLDGVLLEGETSPQVNVGETLGPVFTCSICLWKRGRCEEVRKPTSTLCSKVPSGTVPFPSGHEGSLHSQVVLSRPGTLQGSGHGRESGNVIYRRSAVLPFWMWLLMVFPQHLQGFP